MDTRCLDLGPLIALPAWRVEDSGITREGGLQVRVSIDTLPEACRSCGVGADALRPHGATGTHYIEAPLEGRVTALSLGRRRFICRRCSATTFQPVAAAADSHRVTLRCWDWLRQQYAFSSVVELAARCGAHLTTISAVTHDMPRKRSGPAPAPASTMATCDMCLARFPRAHLSLHHAPPSAGGTPRAVLTLCGTRNRSHALAYFGTARGDDSRTAGSRQSPGLMPEP